MSLGIKLSNFFRLKAEATDSCSRILPLKAEATDYLLSNPSAESGSYRLPVLVPGFRLLVRGFRL
jgi:hypothetical protein